MLKFHLKKERLNFTAAWIMMEKQMIDNGLDGDLLANLLDRDSQEGLDTVIQSINEEDEN